MRGSQATKPILDILYAYDVCLMFAHVKKLPSSSTLECVFASTMSQTESPIRIMFHIALYIVNFGPTINISKENALSNCIL